MFWFISVLEVNTITSITQGHEMKVARPCQWYFWFLLVTKSLIMLIYELVIKAIWKQVVMNAGRALLYIMYMCTFASIKHSVIKILNTLFTIEQWFETACYKE